MENPFTSEPRISIQEELARELKMATPGRADWQYKKIMGQIRNFEEQLDRDHEIALQLASFGAPTLMAVEDIGYQNPDLMYFWGTINGSPAQLIQHTSQLNFVLLSVKKKDPAKPPRRIGFSLPRED